MKIKMEDYQPKTQLFNDLEITNCGYEICPSLHSFGPYARRHYLIHYIIDGKGEYHYNNKVYKLGKNEGFILFPNENTLYIADKTTPWHYYWVGFAGSHWEYILNLCGLNKDNPVFSYQKDNELKKHIVNLYHNSKQKNWNNLTMIGHLYHFFACLYDEKSSQYNQTSEKMIKTALQYMQNNFMNDITVDSIAKELYIHRSYLYKLFKSKYNISPCRYLQNFRLEKASSLLKNSNHNITDIAAYCGFSNTSLFCKAFKNKFNISALKYRKNYRNK